MPTQKVGKRPATSRSGAGSEHHSELCQGEGHRGLDLRWPRGQEEKRQGAGQHKDTERCGKETKLARYAGC